MQYLIVANSPLFSHALVKELAPEKTVIALDGAVNKLIDDRLNFDIAIGDFDSVDWNQINLETCPNTKFITIENQNHTDLEKAIDYCDTHHATQIDIVCATSGRMDHTLRNVGLLRMKYKINRPIFLHTELQTLEFACNKTITMKGQPDDYCGIMAFPAATFSSTGLVYEGNHYELVFGITESTSNQLKTSQATVDIQGEALIIHPGNLQAQRKFAEVSENKLLIAIST